MLKARWAQELEEIDDIVKVFDAVRAKANKTQTIERTRNWERTLRDGRDYKRAQYKYVKGRIAKPTRAMLENGAWTTDEAKLHDLMLRFWKHLYNWYGENKPTYDNFKKEYGAYIQKMEGPTTKITGEGIQLNASRMKNGQEKAQKGSPRNSPVRVQQMYGMKWETCYKRLLRWKILPSPKPLSMPKPPCSKKGRGKRLRTTGLSQS